MIHLAPSGRLIEGHVLDCSKGPLLRKVKEYDDQLYFRWNPKKLQGWGCWELRRRPEHKQIVDYVVYEGNTYTRLEYKENDLVCHIKDFPFLNYKILDWLKINDQWDKSYKAKDFGKELEYKEAKIQEDLEEKADKERTYMLKQHRSQVKDFMSYVNEGGDPTRIAEFWNKV